MSHSRRWVVAYTKHLKQKRKIYHDGVLELSDSGAKVFLYDDSEKLIDSRFLKKHEVIESGGTLTFETHLVDIGSLEGNKDLLSNDDLKLNQKAETLQRKVDNKSTTPSKLPRNALNRTNCRHRAPSMESKPNILGRPLKSPLHVTARNTEVRKNEIDRLKAQQAYAAPKSDLKEWNVLYTTQITQKAKKYHDGILRLLLSGSSMNQIVLLTEDGSVLCSKYLKSAEFIKTGNKCDLPSHLVEICEPRTPCKEYVSAHMEQGVSTSSSVKPTEDIQKISSKPLTSSSSSNIESKKKMCKTHMEGVSSFSSDSVKSTDCNQVQTNKPLRDAYQILQTLKKLEDKNNFNPVAQENASVSADATNQRKDLSLQGDDTCNSNGCTTEASVPDMTSTSSQKTTLKTKLEVDSLAVPTSTEGYSIMDPGPLSTNIQGVLAEKYCSVGEPGRSNENEDTADVSYSILKEINISDSGNNLLGIMIRSAETLNGNKDLQEETKEGRCGMIDILGGSSTPHMKVEDLESKSLSNENFILDDFPTFDLGF